jgi:oligoendopeptidase F
MTKETLPLRSEVPLHETWALENVFTGVDAWESARDKVLELLPTLAAFKGQLSQSPGALADFFVIYEDTMRLALKVMVYGMLASAVDTTDQDAQALAGQGQSVFVRLRAETAFVEPELMTIGFDQLRDWTQTETRLSDLNHYIDQLERQKDHVRSDEVEQVLALSGEPLSLFFRAYTAFTNADLVFEDAVDADGKQMEVGQSSIDSLITHTERNVRRTSYENYAKGYLAFKNTLASLQFGGIQRDIFNARTRHYSTSLEASLDASNIPPQCSMR